MPVRCPSYPHPLVRCDRRRPPTRCVYECSEWRRNRVEEIRRASVSLRRGPSRPLGITSTSHGIDRRTRHTDDTPHAHLTSAPPSFVRVRFARACRCCHSAVACLSCARASVRCRNPRTSSNKQIFRRETTTPRHSRTRIPHTNGDSTRAHGRHTEGSVRATCRSRVHSGRSAQHDLVMTSCCSFERGCVTDACSLLASVRPPDSTRRVRHASWSITSNESPVDCSPSSSSSSTNHRASNDGCIGFVNQFGPHSAEAHGSNFGCKASKELNQSGLVIV
jgi:hypothetical protein